MQHISNVIDLDRVKEQKSQESSNPEQTARVVNLLFKELRAIFPAFKQAWPTEEEYITAKKSWVKAFQASGINTIEQIRYGLRRCRLSGKDFVINSGLFIQWCNPTPEDFNFPSVDEAFKISILINRQFSDYAHEDKRVDSVIRHALNQIDRVAYRSMSLAKAKSTFEHYYAVSIRQFMKGELNTIPAALTHDEVSVTEDEKQKEIAKGFEQCRGYTAAKEAISKILGSTNHAKS